MNIKQKIKRLLNRPVDKVAPFTQGRASPDEIKRRIIRRIKNNTIVNFWELPDYRKRMSDLRGTAVGIPGSTIVAERQRVEVCGMNTYIVPVIISGTMAGTGSSVSPRIDYKNGKFE